mmetsp:Transcript_19977/g.35607  ORF Transcript_19977/g.35607 Transcript_19977/m.35607 type:complete len:433 (-) Transcript_19977:8-1306(-)
MRIPTCLGQRYKIKGKLGQGTFGFVFEAIDLQTGDSVAIKIASPKADRPEVLQHEARVSEGFGGGGNPEVGFPKFYCCSVHLNTSVPITHQNAHQECVFYMVMERLGPSLDLLQKFVGPCLSMKTTLLLMLQMLNRVELFHSKGFIHRDLKPHNFTMGWGDKGYIVYLVDFGLAGRFVDSQRKHIPMATGKGLIGTPWYCSINAHDGYELSRRDDVESLFYIMLFMLHGKLPWRSVHATDTAEYSAAIRSLKTGTEMKMVLQTLPQPLHKFFFHARGLGFETKPNYSMLRDLLRKLFFTMGYANDHMYDWMLKKRTRAVPDSSAVSSGATKSTTSSSVSGIQLSSSTAKPSNATANLPSAAVLLSQTPSMASVTSRGSSTTEEDGHAPGHAPADQQHYVPVPRPRPCLRVPASKSVVGVNADVKNNFPYDPI